MTDLVRLSRAGDIATLTLDRSERRNAISQSMWDVLPALIRAADEDPEVKLLVITGSDEVFCAGADIEEFAAFARDPDWQARNQMAIAETQTTLAGMTKPSIARISGACVGAGCGLALACDFRIASSTARLGITPAKLGITYPLHDTKLLVDLVGQAQARRLLFTAALVDADEALRIGLVDAVHAPETLGSAVETLVQTLCHNSQYSLRALKRTLRKIAEGTSNDDAESRALFARAFSEKDFAEGVAAFLARRNPQFPFR